jgi:Tfp pilus assembly protein PilO
MKLKVQLSAKTFYMLTGAVAVVAGGMIYMTSTSISDQEGHIAKLRAELRDEAEVQKELDDSVARVATLNGKLKHLEAGVQDFAYIPTMLKELEDFGKRNTIQITQVRPIISPEAPKKEGEVKKRESAYRELNVMVKGRGSYENALKFLGAIRNFPKIVAIRTLSLTPKTDAGAKKTAKQTLEMEFEIRAYAFKDEEKQPKVTSVAKGGSNES